MPKVCVVVEICSDLILPQDVPIPVSLIEHLAEGSLSLLQAATVNSFRWVLPGLSPFISVKINCHYVLCPDNPPCGNAENPAQ